MKFSAKLQGTLALAFFSMAIAGCADGGGATSTVTAAENAVCPCMGGEVDGTTSVEWDGKTIGFCCPPCIDSWNEMTDDERTAALEEAKAGGDHADHSNHDDDHAEHNHADHDHADEEAAESTDPAPAE